MNIQVRNKLSEKLAAIELDDSVQNAIDIAVNMGVKKLAVYDKKRNYWVIPLWKLNLLDPNITLKQAYDEKKDIFEKVDTVSSDEEISKVISKLYEFAGLIVIDDEQMKGFISLADFSDSELKQIDSLRKEAADEYKSMTVRQIRQKSEKEGLVGLDLSGIDLTKADMREIDLKGINLHGANLSGANLFKADLTGADLSNANLSGAYLRFAILSGAKLINAKLNKADLRNAKLWHADLEEAQLEEADLMQAVLFNANLKLANLKNANLYKAGLMSAKLNGADLSNTNIRNANFNYAYFDEKTKWNDVDMNNKTIQNITDDKIKRFLKEKYGS